MQRYYDGDPMHKENIDEEGMVTDTEYETEYCVFDDAQYESDYVRLTLDAGSVNIETRLKLDTLKEIVKRMEDFQSDADHCGRPSLHKKETEANPSQEAHT